MRPSSHPGQAAAARSRHPGSGYLLNGPDDGAGNLSFGRTATPPAPRRPFNRTHQLTALIEAAEKLEEGETPSHEVLEELEPGASMGGARPKVPVEGDHKVWLAKLPEKADPHNMQRIEYAMLDSGGTWLWTLAGLAEPRACTTSCRTAQRSGSRRTRLDR